MRACAFCTNIIEPGTGRMYIKKDATILFFCSNKCFKNLLKLGRNSKKLKWSRKSKK
ncbi:MAG: 50S ribosomal protein L24e [Candidatus Thermoplasmatota archaeon]|nr:50S ribosomal protein L24e [Candidatus Thermoplasmatota archaeon]MDI6856129.1 50S ribosomal protein L24e [Candidatus Thermoplasmatota archaeon]MDI6887286.1 50S ribosomal protein L24e [Candidatus Thermoplasmatota archaeon]